MSREESPSTTSETSTSTTHAFQAEVAQVLRLVVHSLYSHPEVFLRELVSNASDALDKLRFRAIAEPSLLEEGTKLAIRIEPDEKNGTLTIADVGVGMTKDELAANLGTIAKSGTRELVEKLAQAKEKANDLSLIGQFGVGFYSAFLVADRVDVISRAAGSREAWQWSSDGQREFVLSPASRVEPGTSVVLHLREDQRELLATWRLEDLVRKYSDYVHFPIELKLAREKDDDAPPVYKTVNRGAPLWQRPASEVTAEQYAELYHHIAHDTEAPLAHDHFKVEGTQEFVGLLYIPRRAPFDLFNPDSKRGLRLYVKRVFILEDADEILPRWLRFVRGVVDSEDLPLNVSRELLQGSRVTKVIKKQVQKHVLDTLGKLAAEKPDDYAIFWKAFGAVLKEGLHFEPSEATKLGKLLRFETTWKGEDGTTKLASLDDAKARMKEGQKALYYATGESRKALEGSPHLEALVSRGYEVLLLTDPVDPFAIEALPQWDGTPLVSATAAELELEGTEPEAKKDADDRTRALRDRIRMRHQDRLAEVRTSSRLVDSAACLVVAPGGLPPHVRRILRQTREDLPEEKRLLEINPAHPVITGLVALLEKKPDHPGIDAWIDDLFDQARLAEGATLEDPGAFARRFTSLVAESVQRAVSEPTS